MKIPRFDLERLKELYLSGKSVSQCHKIMGSPSTDVMFYWLQKHKLMRPQISKRKPRSFIPNKYTLFLQKVNTHNFDPNACWEWTATGNGNGYGGFICMGRAKSLP